MQFDILDGDTLERVGVLGSWVSYLWTVGYNTLGSCTFEVQPTTENLAMLRTGALIRRPDDDQPMRICYYGTDDEGKNLVIEGAPLTWIFTRRASNALIKAENAEGAMRRLVQAMEPWPNLVLGEAVGFTDKFEAQMRGGQLHDYLQTIGLANDLGYKVAIHGHNAAKYLAFEVYRPTLDPNLLYSERWGNINALSYQWGDGLYYNTALVLGAGEGDTRAQVWVGDTTAAGSARRELLVDARDVQPDEDEGETTESASYIQKLIDRGREKLLEQLPTGSITFSTQGGAWQLGDVLTVDLARVGYRAQARVVEWTEQSQGGVTVRTPTVGTPSFTAIRRSR